MTENEGNEVGQVRTDSALQSTNTVSRPSIVGEVSSLKRVSTRHRRASLDEYRATFLPVPKIIDRQPVFVSRETRDRIDDMVRRLGRRKMSVSGFLENLANHHIDLYAEDIEQWKRL